MNNVTKINQTWHTSRIGEKAHPCVQLIHLACGMASQGVKELELSISYDPYLENEINLAHFYNWITVTHVYKHRSTFAQGV